ncbi:MAG: methyltransferase domain-containing protein [Pseudomonadota bacterium]
MIPPDLASIRRWHALCRFGANMSSLRAMEYEAIASMDLAGEVLDFGGGQTAGYMKLLPTNLSLSSVNIDAEFQPTHIVSPGAPLPFADGSFDGAISLNTLEHVADDAGALAEIARVLRPGAPLHICVPFLFRVHGHPDDYHRHTPSGWRHLLQGAGFASAVLRPLVFGRASTRRAIGGRGPKGLRQVTAHWAALRDIAAASIRPRHSGSAPKHWAEAPGWYIRAVAP